MVNPLKKIVAGTGVGLMISMAVIPSWADATTTTVPVRDGAVAGYAESQPAEYGALRANLTAATVTCPTTGRFNFKSFVYAQGGGSDRAFANIVYRCEEGAVSIEAQTSISGAREGAMPVAAGDELAVSEVFSSGAGGHISVTMTDVDTEESISTTLPGAAPVTNFVIGDNAGSKSIPTFTKLQFSEVRFSGTPLGALPGLTRDVMVNQSGKPMIQTSGISPNGLEFSTQFHRNGKI